MLCCGRDDPLSSYFCCVESWQLLVPYLDGSAFEDVKIQTVTVSQFIIDLVSWLEE